MIRPVLTTAAKTALVAAVATKLWPKAEAGIDKATAWAKRKVDEVAR